MSKSPHGTQFRLFWKDLIELFSLHEALQYKDRLGDDFSWQVKCMNAVSNEQIFKSEHFSTSTILDISRHFLTFDDTCQI